MSRKLFLVAMLVLLCQHMTAACADCDRSERTVVYSGKPVPIYLSKEWTEVIFPQSLRAILPEKPTGMVYRESVFHDRLFFSITDPLYFGTVLLEAADGRTYTLRLLGRSGCGDMTDTILDQSNVGSSPPPPPPASSYGHQKTLIEYMIDGDTPPGYTVEEAQGTPAQRLVFAEGLGTVQFYLDKTYRGYNYTGFVLLAVNRGRTPVRVDLQGIDFEGSDIEKTFGHVKQITMQPWDFRLGPAPEYASDSAHPTNEGIVYIVSYNRRQLGGS